jgi:SAM-dependent methyltransferase
MKTLKIYLSDKRALAFYREQATAQFWDKHWETNQLQAIIRGTTDDGWFIPTVKRHLPAGSVILEGGCGMGHLVHALQYQGYKAIGIDFAPETIKNIKTAVPELDVRLGDVRDLPLENNSLDGYVSGGVIEHFWNGYESIAKEMYRTLKAGGFLFISFPYMSLLRRLKVALRTYPIKDSNLLNDQQEQFYQFALTSSCVLEDMLSLGFELREQFAFGGLKGFKDEVALVKPVLQDVYDGKHGHRLRWQLDRLFTPFAAHCDTLVLQKKK